MEFLTPQQKKSKSRRLLIGYGLFSVLISLACYILISTALGYEVFSTKGEVIQNGLLFVNSRPDNADIYINGKKESDATNAKLSLPEGLYSLSIVKEGFLEWKDNIPLKGGAVKFVSYPRLLPARPKQVSNVVLGSTVERILQSKDKRWLAVSIDSSPKIQVFDLNNPTASPVELSLPETIVDGQVVKIVSILDWAGDNRHFLAKVTLNEKPRFIIYDRDPNASITDITDMFALNVFDEVGFWDAKWDKIYIHHADGAVQLGNVKDKSVVATALVADRVKEFFVIGGERAYYTVTQSDGNVAVKLLTDGKSYAFYTLKTSTKPLSIKSAGFNRNEYTLLSGGSLEKTLLFKNLENQVKNSEETKLTPYVLLPVNSSTSEFSRSNRFVLGTDGSTNVIYDLEAKETYKYPTPAKQPALTAWFDDVRLYSVGTDSTLSIYDFNGANLYPLSSTVRGIPYVNSDVSRVGIIVPSGTSTPLRVLDIETGSSTL